MQSNHHQQLSEGADRPNRFLSPHTNGGTGPGSDTSPLSHLTLRERAASQPPRGSTSSSPLGSSPLASERERSVGPGSPYTPRTPSGLNPYAMPQSVPTRSTSFSGGSYNAAFTPSVQRGFPSTLEDDEFGPGGQDTFDYEYDDIGYNSNEGRGRSYAIDITRSRSQSMVPTRQQPIGSPLRAGPWDGSAASSLVVPSHAAGMASRLGQLSAASFVRGPPPTTMNEVSNISPFHRNLEQDPYQYGADEGYGVQIPGSGTTSRRHSVSVADPRREVGFGGMEREVQIPSFGRFSRGGGSGGFDDDELADGMGVLNLGPSDPSGHHQRQPSGEPGSYGRSPTNERISSSYGLKLAMPSSVSYGSPRSSHTDGPMSPAHMYGNETSYLGAGAGRAASQVMGARYIPGQGIQYPNQSGLDNFVTSPGGTTLRYGPPSAGIHGRQPFAPPMVRRASDASSVGAPVPLAEVGKGVPLSAVPSSWPLYIVQFKAGRTDLYYCTNLALDIRIDDLVIVEADRGKDLGKVINDSITHAEVEAFQQEQQARAGWGQAAGDGTPVPTSKEINPKMIYGKASANDAQVLLSKRQEEEKALQLCQAKVRQKKLPMEVIDAEYQWDRRKLTFYFKADRRIDFRELVRELFRLYKTRIWMASLGGPNYEQQ